MTAIDITRTWAAVDQRLATETDPVLRQRLEMLRRHMVAESSGDLDGLMATLAPNPSYHAYGDDSGASSPQGMAAVRTFYENFIASGATRLEFDVDRLVVDRHCILTEGVMRMAWPGRTLAHRGVEVDDPDAFYLYEARMATLWPFDDDGMILGEDTYTGGDGFAGIATRKLPAT